jgi:tetratricopeptide (TPR) repeat protein
MEFTTAKTSARSEKNLKKAEEFGVKALSMEVHASDASVPYFLAIEIYKPQRKWVEMAQMLEEAMARNPIQKLDKPIILDKNNINKDNVLTTIEQAVGAYRKELWVNLYNGALSLYEKGNLEGAMEQFHMALDVDPMNLTTYIALAKFNKENGNLEAAVNVINLGLKLENINIEEKTELYLIDAEIDKEQENYAAALSKYKSVYNETVSITSILSILEINLVTENYLEAIEWGERAMGNRAKLDPSYFGYLLYNIGLAYRGSGSQYYDKAADIINMINEGKEIGLSLKTEGLNNLNLSKENFSTARDYFLDADVEEMEDAGPREKQMKNIIKEINNVYIPFLESYNPTLNE